MELDHVLAEFVQERQIPIFGIACADNFEYALPGWHPTELLPRCKSVIVFGKPFIKHSLTVEAKTHIANDSWWAANEPVYREVAIWRGEIVNLLDQYGLGATNFGGYGPTSEPTFSYRLAQYEAGVGKYGRFGVCLRPDFGCYYYVGVLLTDAVLMPSEKDNLKEFEPCTDCDECAEVCPVRAIDKAKTPPEGYHRERCLRFILKLKQRYGSNVKICSRCFSVCPWGNRQSC